MFVRQAGRSGLNRGALLGVLAVLVGGGRLGAQFTAPPTAYTLVELNATMGPAETLTIYRNGSKAVVDISHPGQPSTTRTLYDLATHSSTSWSLPDSSAGCSGGTFSGDWGDPFAASADMAAQLTKLNLKPIATEPVNGFSTSVYQVPAGAMTIKAWVEAKYGFVAKMQNGATTMLEVQSLKVDAPPASVFAAPARCAAPAGAGAGTAKPGADANLVSAIMAPAQPSTAACAARVSVVHAGTMAPITTGFQVALDLTPSADGGGYSVGVSAGGTARFSGGAIKDLTAQLQNGTLSVPNAPARFYVDVEFGTAGSASALIYRQCPGPQGQLYLVVKNPQKISDGADWFWAKSP
jgi:hypothetical protein